MMILPLRAPADHYASSQGTCVIDACLARRMGAFYVPVNKIGVRHRVRRRHHNLGEGLVWVTPATAQ